MLLPQLRLPTTTQPVRVLILHAQASDAEWVAAQLSQFGFVPDWQHVDTVEAFEAALCQQWDVIIAENALPQFDALWALDILHGTNMDIPFILVTDDTEEAHAITCMEQGAEDYVHRDRMARLGPAIQRAMRNRQVREEHRRTEAALHESKTQFHTLVESLPLPLVITRLTDGHILYANPFARNLLDKLADEIDHPSNLYRDPEQRAALFAELKETGSIRNREVKFKDGNGKFTTMLLSMSLITYKGEPAALVEAQDVTEMHQSLALAAIVQASDDAIISVNMDGIVMSWNAGAQQLYGLPANAVIGQPYTTVFADPNGPEVQEIRAKLRAGEPFEPWETVYTRKDGTQIDVSISMFYVRDVYGVPIRVSGIERDITQRKKDERVLRELHKTLEHRHAELLAIHELGRTLGATLDMREIYYTIYREVGQKLLKVPHLTVALYNDGLELITCDFAIVDGKEIDASELPQIPFGDDVTSDTIRERAARIVDMETLYQRMAERGQAIAIGNDQRMPKSGLYVPMISGDRVIGVVNAQSYEADAFRATDLTLLGTLANYAGIALENARLYAALLSYTDLLEERVAVRTEELNRSKEHVEAIFKHTGDALALVDMNGIIERTNPAFDEMFEFAPLQALGCSLHDYIGVDSNDELSSVLDRLAWDHKQVNLESVGRRKQGPTFDVDIQLAPLMEYSSERLTIICSLRDISQHKLAQAELRKALDKERELGEMRSKFMAMVSHEFRTPLTTIRLATDLLKTMSHRLSDDKRAAQLDKVQQEVKSMTALLEDILTVSRAEQVGIDLYPEPLNVEEFCWKIINKMEVIAGKPRINFNVSGSPQNYEIDPRLIQQALGNLISNALKYSPPDSTVDMSLTYNSDDAVIVVRDYGIGIPDADQAHLAEAFYRAKNVGSIPGTGLGLRIVKQAVVAHGGTLKVESTVGQGSTFTITLPRTQAQ